MDAQAYLAERTPLVDAVLDHWLPPVERAPQALRRAKGPWEERPLQGRRVLRGGAPHRPLTPAIAPALAAAGAAPHVAGRAAEPEPLAPADATYGRPATLAPPAAPGGRSPAPPGFAAATKA